MNLVLEPKKSDYLGNSAQKRKWMDRYPQWTPRESLPHNSHPAPTPLPPPPLPLPAPSLHPCGLSIPGDSLKFKSSCKPLHAAPQVARPSPGWRLASLEDFPAQLPFEKERGAPVPTCWGPIKCPLVQGCKVKKLGSLRGVSGRWWAQGAGKCPRAWIRCSLL